MNSAKSRGSGSIDSGEVAEYPSERREPDLEFHVSFIFNSFLHTGHPDSFFASKRGNRTPDFDYTPDLYFRKFLISSIYTLIAPEPGVGLQWNLSSRTSV